MAGVVIPDRCPPVNLGINMPLSVLEMSSTALGSGVVVPIPTFCCADIPTVRQQMQNIVSDLCSNDFIFIDFRLFELKAYCYFIQL
jgi:hypothetical protein